MWRHQITHVKNEGFGPLVAHGSYTMNLCSAKAETRANGLDMLARTWRWNAARKSLQFSPGSAHGPGACEAGITQIAEALNQVLTPDMHTTVLLETMAGKGSEIGSTFEESCERSWTG